MVTRTLSMRGSSGRPLPARKHAPAVHEYSALLPQRMPSHSESRQSVKPSQSSSTPSEHIVSDIERGIHGGPASRVAIGSCCEHAVAIATAMSIAVLVMSSSPSSLLLRFEKSPDPPRVERSGMAALEGSSAFFGDGSPPQ